MTDEADGDATDDSAVAALSPETLADRLDAGESIRLLDVRDRDEFEAWRIEGPGVTATQIPHIQWLQAKVRDGVADLAAEIDGAGEVVVVCARGEASAEVADTLNDVGVDARNLAGGMEGWARVYRAVELPTDGPATVVQYRRPASGCLAYLIVDDGEAAVVDPLRAFTDRYAADADDRGAEIELVIDTHVHADHVSGLRELAAATDATPVMPRFSVQRGVDYDVETVIDGEELAVGEATLRAIHLPGHTTGMTGVLVGDVLLSGDSLFLESVARPDLEAGAEGATPLARQLYQSLTERLGDLPDQTLVAPGHYGPGAEPTADGAYVARLGDLRERLPIFETERERFALGVVRDMPPRPANFERIVAANLGREALDDAEAFEVELGPNNCAASRSLSG
ncbi:MAG: MBL fold metallo-hydrolase [Haloarculaceae archaeon]